MDTGDYLRLYYELVGMGVTFGLGALFHFTYEWSGKSPATAWFSATDESVWEHMHLVLWPHILVTSGFLLLSHFTGGLEQDFVLSRSLGLLVAMILIPSLFYLYTNGHTNKSYLWVDILIFLFAILAGAMVSWIVGLKLGPSQSWMLATALAIHLVLLLFFTAFAYEKPTDKEPFKSPP
jgi:FtsH-binding integral membrane protein